MIARSSASSSVAIVGCGAIGLYYGGRLALGGVNVSFLARSGAHELKESGLLVQSCDGDFEIPRPVVATESAEVGAVDLVVIAWKATANENLRQLLPPLLARHTRVLTLQNGLGNCEELCKWVEPTRVFGGLCFVCINRISGNEISHTAGGRVAIGAFDESAGSGGAEEIVSLFQVPGCKVELAVSLAEAQWRKLVWNVPFNGLSISRGGVTTDALIADPEVLAQIRELMWEVIAIAAACGHAIEPGWVESNISRTRPMGAYRPSSMIDFTEGREVELDAIWRRPLELAREKNVSVPHLAALVEDLEAAVRERDRT